jgi:hypothetical protein
MRHALNFLTLFIALSATLGLTGAMERLHAAESSADVVVYGGTPGGFAAALAAARNGASVLLVEQTGHIGGLNTSGINTAETEHMLVWTIGGISLEFYERLGTAMGRKGPAFYFMSSTAEKTFNAMLDEARVERRFHQRVKKVEKDGARIAKITLTDGSAVAAKVFIDATYEGDLMARAGVSYTFGRESHETYGEEAAGIRLDKTTRKANPYGDDGKLLPGISAEAKDLVAGAASKAPMNYNFRLCFTQKKENQAPIPAPEKYDPARYTLLKRYCEETAAAKKPMKLTDFVDLYKRTDGKYEVNNKQAAVISLGHFGGQFDYPDASYAQQDAIYADHKEYTLGLLYFLANDPSVPENVRSELKTWGLAKDEFADNGNWPYYLYVREARRMQGRTVMSQQDVQTETSKDDSVGMGSHFIDCHHVQRVAVSPTEFCNEGRIWRIGHAYQIPYRALTPKEEECTNLLVPVAASFSHVAFCTYRVESTWMIGGHAAGTAAALCAKSGTAVQKIDVSTLQEKLKAEKQVLDFIPGQPTKFPHGTNGPPEF